VTQACLEIFQGLDRLTPIITFDNIPLAAGSYKHDAAKKTLTALITSATTAKPGHKQLTLTDPTILQPKPNTQQIPFEVVIR